MSVNIIKWVSNRSNAKGESGEYVREGLCIITVAVVYIVYSVPIVSSMLFYANLWLYNLITSYS